MELADEGGFEAVRLRDVAKRSNVALGTLYARFNSKEDILVAALEQEAVKLEEFLAQYPVQGTDHLERVQHFFTIASAALFTRPNFASAVLKAVASGSSGSQSEVMDYQDRITGLVVNALRGDGPEVAQETEVSNLLEGVWFSVLIGWMSGRESEDDVIDHMKWAAEIVLRGAGIQG